MHLEKSKKKTFIIIFYISFIIHFSFVFIAFENSYNKSRKKKLIIIILKEYSPIENSKTFFK